MREKVHHYRYCPQCKANVEPHYRFCRVCFLWLSRGKSDELRTLQTKPESKGGIVFPRLWLGQQIFQVSFPSIVSMIMVLGTCALIATIYSNTLFPTWLQFGPKLKRNACLANMRIIQTAIEEYTIERPFTRALASDPARVLFDSGFLRNKPNCPIPGNLYKIPKGSRLQCIGSEGHGIP